MWIHEKLEPCKFFAGTGASTTGRVIWGLPSLNLVDCQRILVAPSEGRFTSIKYGNLIPCVARRENGVMGAYCRSILISMLHPGH